jgi:hypothetical protein
VAVLSSCTAITESYQAGWPGAGQWIIRFIHRAKAPQVPAVLLEDSAALVGLVFALLGVVLTWVTHDDAVRGREDLGQRRPERSQSGPFGPGACGSGPLSPGGGSIG